MAEIVKISDLVNNLYNKYLILIGEYYDLNIKDDWCEKLIIYFYNNFHLSEKQLDVLKQRIDCLIKRKTSYKPKIDYNHFENYVKKYNFSDEVNELLLKLYKKVGVYFLYSKDRVVYVGKSVNLSDRIPSSINERSCKISIDSFRYILTNSDIDASTLEMYYIGVYKPILNRFPTNFENLTIGINHGYKMSNIIFMEEV